MLPLYYVVIPSKLHQTTKRCSFESWDEIPVGDATEDNYCTSLTLCRRVGGDEFVCN